MDDHETVLSEVHLGIPVSSTATNVLSRFEFTLPHNPPETSAADKQLPLLNKDDSVILEKSGTVGKTAGITGDDALAKEKAAPECTSKRVNDPDESAPMTDTIGDQSPPRRSQPREVILIEHHMATRLANVGLQVWPAALLMADFLIDNGARWKNSTILEFGGGVGLCGIVAAMFARRTICSDYLAEIVETMKGNFRRNSSLLRGEYECRLLDVRLTAGKESSPSTAAGLPAEAIPACDVILASDVIYCGEITDALMALAKRLLRRGKGAPSEFYIALERRLNFTIEALAVSCPAYEYFLEVCHQLELSREQVDLSQLPTYFKYERSEYLELHRITLGSVGTK